MKQKDLIAASKELNKLLFDPDEKENGWIDITGGNIKKMTKGIKEAAAIFTIEDNDKLTDETKTTLREIDWNLEDYDDEDQKEVQKTLQDMGIWVNEDVDEKEEKKEEPEPEEEKEEKSKKKSGGKKKEKKAEKKEEPEPEEKAEKKEKKPKKEKGVTRAICICQAMASIPKKGKTIDEVAEIADKAYTKAGGTSNLKQTAHHIKVLIPAAVEWELLTVKEETLFPV